ncbi:uncharacterized protein THITE_155185 [Thermothielavioides terrestris NRRL 8126]|uniref:Uncharacterized protein n=1 Tax=Thermothielavioides terrestris (strain ATCC 38088 / NRRL 8126) TaxID=578455 RepID=G2QUC7_THETT|nr:uncharacterized protein THITE_155185 [Thermothielavioides terrestris NRRL 8126]AEO63679.1 hypothetical protein THITE_155185 [Thermothielavioides terrestris NRRL 8126]
MPSLLLATISDHDHHRHSTLTIYRDACLGLFLAIAALGIAARVSFWSDSGPDDGAAGSLEGFSYYSIGSVLLSLGSAGCGYVVRSATTEASFQFQDKDRRSVAVMWLQRACTV